MKKICTTFICLFTLCGTFIFAQEAKIELPELSTEVSGVDVVAENDSLPDFKMVIDLPPSSEDIVPVLPEENIPENKYEPSMLQEPAKMHGDGLIGGGYPGVLIGEFNLNQIDEENPLELNFLHNSAYGYAGKSLLSGYSDRNTQINLDKTFTLNTIKLDLQGAFKTLGNGLQSQQEYFSAINQNQLCGNITFEWEPVKTFTIGTNVNAVSYNRYLDATKNAESYSSIPRYETELNLFDLNPTLFFRWEDYGFTVGLNGSYTLNFESNKQFETLHRGFVQTAFGWKNDIFNVKADVGIVFGNQMEPNKVIIPFTVGVYLNMPSYFSTRNIIVSLYGGLDSKETSIISLETKKKFSTFSCAPLEQSDWFGAFELMLPIKSSFTGNAFIEYRHTAFDNGIWDVDYNKKLASGLYGYSKVSRQSLKTVFDVSYKYKIFSIGGKWKSNWFYVPSLETAQAVGVNLAFQDENALWGTELSADFPFVYAIEYVPIVDFEAFVTISKSIRIMLNANDIIKLVSGTTRLYAGNYVERGGSATLSVKYIF